MGAIRPLGFCRSLLPRPNFRAERWAVFGALLLAACHRQTIVRPGDQPTPGEVIVVGRALMNPVIRPRDDAPMNDAFDTGYFTKLALFFYTRPDGKIDPDDLQDLGDAEEYLTVSWEYPFAARLPTKTLYLRVMRQYVGTERDVQLGRPTATMYFASCLGAKRVELKTEDRFVYIGTFTCDHADGKPVAIRVNDELEALRPHLPGLIGGATPIRRIAVDPNAPPVAEQPPSSVPVTAPKPKEPKRK